MGDSTKGSTRPTNIFRAGYLPLPCRPDTTEPRMAVLMKPDDRLPVQRIRGSNVEQIIGEGKRKSRERERERVAFHLSTFRLPVVSSSDRRWKRESTSKRGETDEERGGCEDKYHNSFIAMSGQLDRTVFFFFSSRWVVIYKRKKGITLSKNN